MSLWLDLFVGIGVGRVEIRECEEFRWREGLGG